MFFLVFTHAFLWHLRNWELFAFNPTFGFIFLRVFVECFQSLLVSRFPGCFSVNLFPSASPDDASHFPIFHLSASVLHSGGNLKRTSWVCSRVFFLHFGNSCIAFGMTEWVCVLLTYACVSKPCTKMSKKLRWHTFGIALRHPHFKSGFIRFYGLSGLYFFFFFFWLPTSCASTPPSHNWIFMTRATSRGTKR